MDPLLSLHPPPQEPAPVIVISSDNDTEDSAGTDGEPSSDNSSRPYSTSTSSSDAMPGRNFDSTDRSSGSSSRSFHSFIE
ncbi:hypothetical protein PIB30_052827 [Stylosanthes scabra]|uniref:Uncharacterized protein n=1 Tax=Stylosanthes scabra TaxID=79078 RepID=A0ABU6ZH55_9FABA|nr:hypothetical protein [Stylosanthes scabra]